MEQIKALGNSIRKAGSQVVKWVQANRTIAIAALIGIVLVLAVLYLGQQEQAGGISEAGPKEADEIASTTSTESTMSTTSSNGEGVLVNGAAAVSETIPAPANLLDHYQFHVDYPDSKITDETGNSRMSRSKHERADDCRAHCDQTDWCHFWEHNPEQHACHLYQTISRGSDYRAAIEPHKGSHVGVFERKLHA